MMSIAENINSIYDIAKEERKMISSYGLMSNKFNRLTLKSLRASSASKSSFIFKVFIVSNVQFLFRFHVVFTF